MRKTTSRPRAVPALMLNVLILGAPALAGCAATTGSGGRDVFCGAAAPIRWSAADTDETIRQVKGHNAAGRALCGWR
ncbi:hypothetical protein [Aquabacter cavernae]|uniref:hypothetical protein n=1 Tax=Aquabacter cavernae TaxID=2496029 RepID=UPI0013E0450D|nr:hypothetical protein [Aquabacter cavernae]